MRSERLKPLDRRIEHLLDEETPVLGTTENQQDHYQQQKHQYIPGALESDCAERLLIGQAAALDIAAADKLPEIRYDEIEQAAYGETVITADDLGIRLVRQQQQAPAKCPENERQCARGHGEQNVSPARSADNLPELRPVDPPEREPQQDQCQDGPEYGPQYFEGLVVHTSQI